MQEEFYTRPLLAVREVTASIEYYCEKLGFVKMWSSPDSNPIIAQVGRNGLEIMLNSKSVIPMPAIPTVLTLTLHRADQLDTLYNEFVSRGATIATPPFEVVWERNLFQFDVEDPDGNKLIFWGNQREAKTQQ